MKRLSNGVIEIAVKTVGAELSSLKKANDSYEYMWQGDPAFWTGQSPVLFPIVGSLIDGEIEIEGKMYAMGNHGIARKREFFVVEESDEKLVFQLSYDDETLKQYPYKFKLMMAYALDENMVEITYTVVNEDERPIHFQIGTHPAFNCPMEDGLSLSDYYIGFEKAEKNSRLFVTDNNLLITAYEEEGLDGNRLDLDAEKFYDGALIYKDLKSGLVTLKTDKGSRKVMVSHENLPYLGIWQKEDAPYLCIEPWHGLATKDDGSETFESKDGMVCLQVGTVFQAKLIIGVE